MFKKFNAYYFLLILFIAAYVTILFSMPTDADTLTRYSISVATFRIITLVFIVPYIAIWFVAFLGFVRVKEYAKTIQASKDGAALKTIGDGLMILASSLPILAIASSARNYLITRDSSLRADLTILYNYLALVTVLLGFYLLSKGAKQLVGTLERPSYNLKQKLLTVVLILLCAGFVYATVTNPARQFPAESAPAAAYYLQDSVLIPTVVIPYVLVWYFGSRAAFDIYLYRRKAKGIIYKKALVYLSTGIGFVLMSTMFMRILSSMAGLLDNLTLKLLLVVLYLLLFVISIGYVLITMGASRLKKIEEV